MLTMPLMTSITIVMMLQDMMSMFLTTSPQLFTISSTIHTDTSLAMEPQAMKIRLTKRLYLIARKLLTRSQLVSHCTEPFSMAIVMSTVTRLKNLTLLTLPVPFMATPTSLHSTLDPIMMLMLNLLL